MGTRKAFAKGITEIFSANYLIMSVDTQGDCGLHAISIINGILTKQNFQRYRQVLFENVEDFSQKIRNIYIEYDKKLKTEEEVKKFMMSPKYLLDLDDVALLGKTQNVFIIFVNNEYGSNSKMVCEELKRTLVLNNITLPGNANFFKEILEEKSNVKCAMLLVSSSHRQHYEVLCSKEKAVVWDFEDLPSKI